MALSRAAAAAARKAAKSRGLKGNRAKDGSLLQEEAMAFYEYPGQTPTPAGYQAIAREMTDAELKSYIKEVQNDIANLERISAKAAETNFIGFDNLAHRHEMTQARNKLEVFEDVLDERQAAPERISERELEEDV